ncbi:Acetylcholine receptor subunit alpha-type acr-16 [Toxocara canis]|uniref:Acetylcholine receptor subunit alpha-type acr-16 n=1 Tax=Toxocara canis TaxID=6265 RepID=A0A0B2UV84_TOXCA|nr:Acetylcholine receptor subunit alpha-type acr-16 [Toxocara canis]
MVADVTPPTSESVPVIAAFFSVSMLILGCSVMITVLIINLHFRTPRTHKMSDWMRSVFLEWMPWLLVMARPGQRFERPEKRRKSTTIPSASSPSSSAASRLADQNPKVDSIVSVLRGASITSIKTPSELQNGHLPKVQLEQSNTSVNKLPRCMMPLLPPHSVELSKADVVLSELMHEVYFVRIENTMREVSDFLKILRQRMEEDDEEEEENYDWHFVAMVVDRFCLFLFSGAILFASSFILINTPHVLKNNSILSQ